MAGKGNYETRTPERGHLSTPHAYLFDVCVGCKIHYIIQTIQILL